LRFEGSFILPLSLYHNQRGDISDPGARLL